MWSRIKRYMPQRGVLEFDGLDVYARLDIKHDLADHGISREFFNTRPEFHARWIRIYFANTAIVKGRVQLQFFLENNPSELLSALLANPRPIHLEGGLAR